MSGYHAFNGPTRPGVGGRPFVATGACKTCGAGLHASIHNVPTSEIIAFTPSPGQRPLNDEFRPGAKVYVDGRDLAIVRGRYPKGSTSFLFPHYKVDYVDGDQNVAVAFNRVGLGS